MFPFLPLNLFICVPEEASALTSAWSSFSSQGGGLSSYFGAEGPLVSLSSSCFWSHSSSSVFLDLKTSLCTVEGDKVPVVCVGKWLRKTGWVAPPWGEVNYCMPRGHLALLLWLLHTLFFFTSGASVSLFVHHRLLHSNTLNASGVPVTKFPLCFSEHQYKPIDSCCASWDSCRIPH